MIKELYKAYCKSYTLEKEKDSDFFRLIEKQYYSDEVQGLEQYEQHLEINRLQHITSVTYLTYKICNKLNLDTKSAAKGAVLHDLFYYDWRDDETGRWHKLHGYKHPKYATYNARELCPDITQKELDIITRHMWPLTIRIPNSKEGFIVSLSDKYCATMELLYSKVPSFKQKFLTEINK